ncbi:pyridoxal phosphate-dependent aminotransferase [Phytohalomonas tamaricis]|uniref:pyridoxal phosphate-dependent aminotransferase n=1 Tax=Phytohalomonas tamaricis TaxID=2081032 RepID=UPI000D0BDB50|nr:histidinol-phosphate transaminase [Phytohalomonas tamaricis]
MSSTASHLNREGPFNPFPGLRALERRLGRELSHQLGSNEGLDMPHQALKARLGDDVARLARGYGDAEAFGVRTRLRQRFDIPMDALLVDAGADSLMALALRTLCDVGSAVITSAGTYPTFRYFAEGQGCRLVEVPYLSEAQYLAPDLDALADAAHHHHARAVYLANPDNPSGHLHSDADIDTLCANLPADCTLILDEAYHDFRPQNAESRVRDGVIRLRTFSKAHGLAGLRIGYAIAPPGIIAMMHKVRIHYAVSSLALEAAEIVLDHDEEVQTHIHDVVARREQLAAQLRALGGDVPNSATNFIAIRMNDADTAAAVQKALLDEGVLIHRPPHPALGHVLRISAVEDALVPGRLAALERTLTR